MLSSVTVAKGEKPHQETVEQTPVSSLSRAPASSPARVAEILLLTSTMPLTGRCSCSMTLARQVAYVLRSGLEGIAAAQRPYASRQRTYCREPLLLGEPRGERFLLLNGSTMALKHLNRARARLRASARGPSRKPRLGAARPRLPRDGRQAGARLRTNSHAMS